MSDLKDIQTIQAAQTLAAEKVPAAEIEKLPQDMKVALSVMAGLFRSTTGPDPETAKIMAETEMHEETCRLQAYGKNIELRNQQSERDHNFRKLKLNHDTAKSFVLMGVCVAFMICGLYLLVAKHDTTVGTPLIIGGFTVLSGKVFGEKSKD